MVFKPSPFVPVLDLVLAEIIEECDLPRGVYNVVTGESPELGTTLVESPLVDKISFTGSVATGKAILAAAAPTLKRVHLELGGKSASIILDDSNLDMWAMATSGPSFFHAGQGCAMCTRVLVPKRLHDSLVEKMTGFVGAIVKVGDPSDPSCSASDPRGTPPQDRVHRLGQAAGATLATGGGRPKISPGLFLEPTIFCGVDNSCASRARSSDQCCRSCRSPTRTKRAYRQRLALRPRRRDLQRRHAKALEMAKRIAPGS
jgi:aldehyde dehydrogenase (NAD+)